MNTHQLQKELLQVSENLTSKDDPCDDIDVNILDGWTRYDSDRMRRTNNEKELERDQGRGHSNPWIRFGDG